MTQFFVHELDSEMPIDTSRGEAITFLLRHYPVQAELEELYFFGNAVPLRAAVEPELFRTIMQEANTNERQALTRIQDYVSRHPFVTRVPY